MTIQNLKSQFQAIREVNSSQTYSIPAHFDNDTARLIVLMSDIQNIFPNLQFILDGDELVPQLIGRGFRVLDPERIAYRPDVTLQVVSDPPLAQNLHVYTYSQPVKSYKSKPYFTEDSSRAFPPPYDDAFMPVPVPVQSITEMQTNVTLNKLPGLTTSRESDGSIQRYNQLHGSYIQALTTGQAKLAMSIKNDMSVQFEKLRAEMNTNSAFLEQLLFMQLHLSDNQEKMLTDQKQTLEKLNLLQDRIEAVITQTYELHEFPIPRLFIVLPKPERLRDKVGKLFVQHFRLYFLCECGKHTMPEGSTTLHKVHLARHEGYDIHKPTEFFERYGGYLLAMMQLFKHGVTIAGLVVPALAHSQVVEGIESFQEYFKDTYQNLSSLVDETILFLQSKAADSTHGDDVDSASDDLSKVEVLEGADLRQLESFLKNRDEGRVLGNLFRIVTQEGHVKWVCIEHYRENYRESSVKQLRNVVSEHDGEFTESVGLVKISLQSSNIAKQFYDAVSKARGIHELDVTLTWDATMDDLRKLCLAVTNSNIANLTIDGSHFNRPTLDIVNRYRRYDPIIQLMCNKRIQSLNLRNFTDFFTRVSINNSLLTMAPRLHVLQFESISDFNSKNTLEVISKTISNIIDISPSFKQLCFSTCYPVELLESIKKKLDSITIQYIDLERKEQQLIAIVTYYRNPDRSVSNTNALGDSISQPRNKDGPSYESKDFKMRITIEGLDPSTEYQFFDRYGRYFRIVEEGCFDKPELATKMERSITIHGSKLKTMFVSITNRVPSHQADVQALTKIVNNSPFLERINMNIESQGDLSAELKGFLINHGSKVHTLRLSGETTCKKFSEFFSTKSHFPELEYLTLVNPHTSICEDWIPHYLSSHLKNEKGTKPRYSPYSSYHSSYSSYPSYSNRQTHPAPDNIKSKPLKGFTIKSEFIIRADIDRIAHSIDFYTMEELDLDGIPLNLNQLEKFLEYIPSRVGDRDIIMKKLTISPNVPLNSQDSSKVTFYKQNLEDKLPSTEIVFQSRVLRVQ